MSYFQNNRHASFTNSSSWPHPKLAQEMASAGFLYMGYGDCVQCFVCNIKLNQWTPQDDPMARHKEYSPNCMFASIGKVENDLTVEEWCDIMCAKAINSLDHKFNQLLQQPGA